MKTEESCRREHYGQPHVLLEEEAETLFKESVPTRVSSFGPNRRYSPCHRRRRHYFERKIQSSSGWRPPMRFAVLFDVTCRGGSSLSTSTCEGSSSRESGAASHSTMFRSARIRVRANVSPWIKAGASITDEVLTRSSKVYHFDRDRSQFTNRLTYPFLSHTHRSKQLVYEDHLIDQSIRTKYII